MDDDFGNDFQDDYVDSDEEPSASSKQTAKRGGSNGARSKGEDHAGRGTEEPPPPSFSLVNLSLPPEEIAARFPLFPGIEASLDVILEAGTNPAEHLPACSFTFLDTFYTF